MKWIDIKKEGLPKEDGLFIIEANSGGRWQMFFKIEDQRWYWQPNPYSVSGDGIVVKWLDESKVEPVFTEMDMWSAYCEGKMEVHGSFKKFMKKEYNLSVPDRKI